MMLVDKIYKDYIETFKARNKDKADFLSFVRAEFQNLAISAKKDKLEDSEALGVLQKLKKRLEEAKESVIKSGKSDFIEKTEKEIAILAEYLPKALSEAESTSVINEVTLSVGATSIKDMGKVMKEVLARVGAQADSKTVSDLVKKKLSSN
ncbi:MAG: GatB/YqeY domain-containing protein [Candidatus Omnitrophota bacterium]|nr:GatB/YqeY domain-containing protein [Candidatus Omnitrophota bacterium]